MKRLALCAWAGFVAYAVTLFIYGPAGFSSMSRLEAEQARISSNLEELRAINDNLALRVQALNSDRETIQVESRKYGYIAKGERLVQVQGLKSPKTYLMAGKILKFREKPTQGGFLPVCAALIVACIALFLSLSLQNQRRRTA
jgi:cell division protein FtsB